MYRVFKHKKGQGFEDVLPYVALLILVVFIILLSVNYSEKKREDYIDVQVELDSIEAEKQLLDFLEKKVEVDRENITISNLINVYYYEKKHEAILVNEMEEMLNSLPKPVPVSGWNLHIYFTPEDETVLKVTEYDVLGWFKKASIIAYVPLPNNPEENLKLDLWLECQC